MFFFLTVSAHKCFVCKPNHMRTEDQYDLSSMFNVDQLKFCSDFKKSRRHEFLLECPEGSAGCSTKFNGNKLRINHTLNLMVRGFSYSFPNEKAFEAVQT